MFARSETNVGCLVARFDPFRDSLRPRERSSSEGDAPFVLNSLSLAGDFDFYFESISSLIILALVAASRRKSIRMHEGSELARWRASVHAFTKERKQRESYRKAVPFIPFPESYLDVEHLDVKLRDESR